MRRSIRLLAFLALVASTTEGHAQLLDHEGNPLPRGAIARVGSTRMRHGGGVSALAYLDKGKTLVSLTAEEVRWWDAATGKRKHGIDRNTDYPHAFRISPDDQTVQYFTARHLITVSTRDGKEMRRQKLFEKEQVLRSHIAADAPLLLAVAEEGLWLFDMTSGKEKLRIPLPNNYRWAALSADGKTIANVDRRKPTVDIYDASTGQLRTSLPIGKLGQRRPFLSYDGKLLVIGTEEKGPQIWDLTRNQKVAQVGGEASEWIRSPICGAFSPDNKYVALGSQWKYTVVVETATGKEFQRFLTYPSCMCVTFSPDGKTLAIGTNIGEVTQWDVRMGKSLPGSANPIGTYQVVGFTNEDNHLLVTSKTHLILDWRKNQIVHRFPQTTAYMPWHTSINLKTSLLTFYDRDKNRVVIWDANSGKEKWHVDLKSPWIRTELCPDGSTLVTANETGLHGLDAKTGKELWMIKEQIADDEISKMAISPDSRWLATVSYYPGRVRLWNLSKKKSETILGADGIHVESLAFSHDNRRLFAIAGSYQNNRYIGAVHKHDLVSGKRTVFRSTTKPMGTHDLAVSPDDRTLCVIDANGENCYLWEIAAEEERCHFTPGKDWIWKVAFSSDGSLLATTSNAGPLLVWDIYGKHQRKGPPIERWTDAEQDRVWKALASAKAPDGFAAVCQLIQHPPAALALLRERMKPARSVDVKKVRPLLADLQSETFATRQKAFAQLEKQGDAIAGFLEKELPGIDNLEAKRRVERLLEKWTNPAQPELLRWNRALEALEQIADEPARRLVADLAAGDPLARSTILAQETRDRLARKAQVSAKP